MFIDGGTATAILMRHGETAWNRDRRVMGDLDIPLSDDGRLQSGHAARLLESFAIDRIVSSPLVRAKETAEIVAQHLGRTIETDPRLVEVRFGEWQGKTYEEVATDPRYHGFATDPVANATPGGDTAESVQRRGLESLATLRAGECVLFVTHGDIIRTLICHFLATPLVAYRRIRTDNGGLSAIAIGAGAPEVKFLNMLADPERARSHTHWSATA
ncbi:MAG TPA: histidine phosphatase family protein [Candidatus Limnocylindrales bacterium]|nr:histidine phosphatase family protein [Candidatus Limnocylindrales bacterium]